MLERPELATYVARQLNHFFPDRDVTSEELMPAVSDAIARAARCFCQIKQKFFFEAGRPIFNHLHTDQYAIFLYYLSNVLSHRSESTELASKVYALNKALHGVDLFYAVQLPEIFCLQHPVGTVLGRGTYSNYFFAYQRCTVGGNADLVYPTLGDGVVMYGGSALIGNCAVGGNSWVSAGTIVIDQDIPPDSVVFGRSPNLIIKPAKRNVIRDIFQGGR
jgi:serine O-acetyltransferase